MLVEVTCAEGERHHVSRGVNVVFEDLRWQGEAGGGGTGEGGEDGENGADVASGGGLVGTVVGIKGLGGFTVKLTTRDALASGPDGASDELSEHDHPLVKGLRSGRALASAVALRPKVRHAHHLVTRLPHHLVNSRPDHLATRQLFNGSTLTALHAPRCSPQPTPRTLRPALTVGPSEVPLVRAIPHRIQPLTHRHWARRHAAGGGAVRLGQERPYARQDGARLLDEGGGCLRGSAQGAPPEKRLRQGR